MFNNYLKSLLLNTIFTTQYELPPTYGETLTLQPTLWNVGLRRSKLERGDTGGAAARVGPRMCNGAATGSNETIADAPNVSSSVGSRVYIALWSRTFARVCVHNERLSTCCTARRGPVPVVSLSTFVVIERWSVFRRG